jgi:penicillin-binding protein 1A
MGRALKDVPQQTLPAPDGLVSYGSGRERTYIYTENVERDAPQDGEDDVPLPRPEPDKPPTD